MFNIASPISYCSNQTQSNTSSNTILFFLVSKHQSQTKLSEGNRPPTRQFVKVGDVQLARSQLLDLRMSSSEVKKRINAISAPLTSQLEMIIQSVRELSEKKFESRRERGI